jgi:uncharacterized protein with GYD domain
MKFTDQGARTIKESPARLKASIEMATKMGAKIQAVYYTHGEYDLITIAEWPSDEAATTFLLGVAAQGNVHTATYRAISVDEMAALVKKLP